MVKLDAASLIEAEHARRRAIEAGDFAKVEAMTADHFHYAHVNGLVEDRQAYFARAGKDPGTRIFETYASELSAQLRDGYALLAGRSYISAVAGIFDTLFLSVWEPDADGWKIVAYSSTPRGPDA